MPLEFHEYCPKNRFNLMLKHFFCLPKFELNVKNVSNWILFDEKQNKIFNDLKWELINTPGLYGWKRDINVCSFLFDSSTWSWLQFTIMPMYLICFLWMQITFLNVMNFRKQFPENVHIRNNKFIGWYHLWINKTQNYFMLWFSFYLLNCSLFILFW